MSLHFGVRYDWTPAKRLRNLAKHGIDFTAAEDFEWASAVVWADTRQHYNEVRLLALRLINARLHMLVFTVRRTRTWVISLRKANNKEIDWYEGEIAAEHARRGSRD